MNELQVWVKNEVIEKLEECRTYENKVGNIYDLAYVLFESENVNGSYYCSTYKALEWIKKYFEYLGDYVDEYNNYFGDNPSNPFNEAEYFQVQLILFIAQELLIHLDLELDEINLTLTDEVIDVIIEALNKGQ